MTNSISLFIIDYRGIELLTIKEIAERLKVHPQTVYRWIYTGKLEAIKIDGILRVEEEAYNRFIGKHNEGKSK